MWEDDGGNGRWSGYARWQHNVPNAGVLCMSVCLSGGPLWSVCQQLPMHMTSTVFITQKLPPVCCWNTSMESSFSISSWKQKLQLIKPADTLLEHAPPTGTSRNSVWWMCTLNKMTWPDLTHLIIQYHIKKVITCSCTYRAFFEGQVSDTFKYAIKLS